MGSIISSYHWDGKPPEPIPPAEIKPTFDPNYGFKAPRKPRVSKLSEQEMKALKIPKSLRDYCAHHVRDYKMCLRKYAPFIGFCNPERFAHQHCEVADLFLRMKEYEREKRLRAREFKKQGKTIQ